MNEAIKPQENTFKNYYFSLDETIKVAIRNKVMNECGFSYPTFYSKLKHNNYSILERKAIESICQLSFQWQNK